MLPAEFGFRTFCVINAAKILTWNYSQTSATNRTSEGKLWRFVLSLDKTWRTRPSIVLWRGPPSKTWRPTPMQTIRIYSIKNATWRKPCVKVCYPSDVALVKHFIYIVYTEKTCSLIVLCEQGWRATGRITSQWPRISVLMKSSKKRWRTFLWPASGRWVSSCSPIQLSSLLQRTDFLPQWSTLQLLFTSVRNSSLFVAQLLHLFSSGQFFICFCDFCRRLNKVCEVRENWL